GAAGERRERPIGTARGRGGGMRRGGGAGQPQLARAPWMIPAARAALSRTRFQSPAASQSFGTIHEPPMHSTLGWARNSPAFDSLMPPVGHSLRPPNGPASPLSMVSPPTALAGNSLQQRKPCA